MDTHYFPARALERSRDNSNSSQGSLSRDVKYIKSADNLKTFFNPQKLPSSKYLNIYTTKAGFSPAPVSKSGNKGTNSSKSFGRLSDKFYRYDVSASLSRDDRSMTSEKSKAYSVDKGAGKRTLAYGHSHSGQHLLGSNYLAAYRDRMNVSKVKKSFRHNERVNFYYNSNNR